MIQSKNTDLVLAAIQEEPYARSFTLDEINQALTSALRIFSDCEQKFATGFCGVILRPNGSFQRSVSFATELIQPILYAHRFFGDVLPTDLVQKLTNQTQTHDTLFELICLGRFQQYHNITYEPKLVDGKVPDLMLTLTQEQQVYVECKSQSVNVSKHTRLFQDASRQIHDVLSTKQSAFVENAWANGLRIEVRLSRSPASADIRALQETLDKHTPSSNVPSLALGNSISLSLIARDQPFDQTLSSPSAVMTVGTTPIEVHHKNASVAVYPWRRLDSIRRQSQRRLLKSARRKLASIPRVAYGLICIQTFSSKQFAPDVHNLLKQSEYERIPIVWLNPMGKGRLIFRDDALFLRDAIFGGIMEGANQTNNTDHTEVE